MTQPAVRFVRGFKTVTKHADLHIEGTTLITRAWNTDAKDNVVFERVTKKKSDSPAAAAALLSKAAAFWKKEKYELDSTSAPLPPAPVETPLPPLIARLDSLSFAWKKKLRKGAAKADIDGLEKRLKVKLPPDLADFLRWRNGMPAHELNGFRSFGQRWMPLGCDDIEVAAKILTKVDRKRHAGLIPFLHNASGDYVCVDTLGKLGRPGEVIVSWRDQDASVVHPNFAHWLSALVDAMQDR